MNIKLETPYSFIRLGNRTNQEDCRYPNTDICSSSQGFFMICDGVGGADAGEIASKTVCDVFQTSLFDFSIGDHFPTHQINELTFKAFNQLASIQPHIVGRQMATTLAFLCFHSKGVTAAHLGDSRIYQVRPNIGLLYKSKDHSLVENLKDEGLISEEQAQIYPQKNIITRCIMAGEGAEYYSPTVMLTNDVCPGDVFFLCTDGVYGALPEENLIQILSDSTSPAAEILDHIAAQTVLSDDNNTAILIKVQAISENSKIKYRRIFDLDHTHKKSFNIWKMLKDSISRFFNYKTIE